MPRKDPPNSLDVHWSADYIFYKEHRIVEELKSAFKASRPKGKDASEGEVRAWRESLPALASALKDAGREKLQIFPEYRASMMAANVDAVIAGQHPNGLPSYAVIELKRWSKLVEHPDPSSKDSLCRKCKTGFPDPHCTDCRLERLRFSYSERPEGDESVIRWEHVKHPAIQVRDNMDALQRSHSIFADRNVNLAGAAYLHNLSREDSQWLTNVSPSGTINIPVFTARQPADFEQFLKTNFSQESGAAAAQELLGGQRTSALLTTEVGKIIRGYARFSLLGNQRTAVEEVAKAVRSSPPPGAKRVFVVSGRAGTGKTLVALKVLGDTRGNGLRARYVSGGIASRDTFKRESNRQGSSFPTLNHIADNCGPDEIDLIVCDEAHRLPEYPKTGSFSNRRDGESSVSVVVTRARVPVFFIDGDQRLFQDEIWTPDALNREIRKLGAEVVDITLDRVLRAVGSATYDTWVRLLLEGDPRPWDRGDSSDPDPFELYYADRAEKMEDFLRAKGDAGMAARITAGMCWKWDDRTGTVPEVRPEGPGGWARPWNAGDTHETPGVPKRKFWATDPGGFGQIGCVHTAQGLEYEWGGVIMGPDLTWESGRWALHREAVKSKANRILSDDDLGQAIRNAYGVLMTRSIRGTVLYSTDPATRELFAELGIPKV
jgi:hypothetical protein